jgi:outer membrane protein assembly factor BamB
MADDGGHFTARCPSCGAPLGNDEDERCEYCGNTIDSGRAATRYAVREAEALSKRAWRRSWVYVLGFAGLSSMLAFFGQWRATNKARTAEQSARQAALARLGAGKSVKPERERLGLMTLLASLPQPDGKLAVLFATRQSPDHPLLLVDAATGAVRWRSGPYATYVNRAHVALLDDKLFVVEGARLTALATGNGAVLWQTSLIADHRDYSDALRAAAGRVAVLLRDGSTQVFDAGTGETVWTRKRTPPPNRLAGAADHLVEFVRLPKKRGFDEYLAVVDLADGTERHRLRPRCSTHSIIPANQPSSSSPLAFSDDGEEMYLFYGFNRFCVERWNLRSGSLAWQVNRRGAGEASVIGGKLESLLGHDLLFYPAGDGVYAVERQSGELRKVLGDAEHRLVPALADDTLLVVTAIPAWEHGDCNDAKNCALWGVDLAQGNVRWRYALPTESKSSRRGADERFAGRLTPEGLTLAVGSGQRIILDRLDRDTGVVRSHKVLKQDGEIRSIDFRDGLLWLDARAFVAIDPETGATRYRLE